MQGVIIGLWGSEVLEEPWKMSHIGDSWLDENNEKSNYLIESSWAEHQVGSDKDINLTEGKKKQEISLEDKPNFNNYQQLWLDFTGNSTGGNYNNTGGGIS